MTSFELNEFKSAAWWHSPSKVMKFFVISLFLCVAGCVAVLVFVLMASGMITFENKDSAQCGVTTEMKESRV